MRVTVELSLYPMTSGAVPEIVEFIDAVSRHPSLRVAVNQMSTQLTGELDAVLEVLGQALRRSFGSDHSQVLVAKFLNKALPVDEPPDLESFR